MVKRFVIIIFPQLHTPMQAICHSALRGFNYAGWLRIFLGYNSRNVLRGVPQFFFPTSGAQSTTHLAMSKTHSANR